MHRNRRICLLILSWLRWLNHHRRHHRLGSIFLCFYIIQWAPLWVSPFILSTLPPKTAVLVLYGGLHPAYYEAAILRLLFCGTPQFFGSYCVLGRRESRLVPEIWSATFMGSAARVGQSDLGLDWLTRVGCLGFSANVHREGSDTSFVGTWAGGIGWRRV